MIDATFEQVAEWNRRVDSGARAVFEHRVLLGIGISSRRPEHGKVMEYHRLVAGELERSARWVRETVRVADALKEAIEAGIPVPLEIRDIAWAQVPTAIVNLRVGRPLGWREPDEDEDVGDSEADPEAQVEARVAEAVEALVEALGAVGDSQRRTELLETVIARLRESLESEPMATDPGVDSSGLATPAVDLLSGRPAPQTTEVERERPGDRPRPGRGRGRSGGGRSGRGPRQRGRD